MIIKNQEKIYQIMTLTEQFCNSDPEGQNYKSDWKLKSSICCVPAG